tara:strand:+ start:666 stop:950 length:285 start_codon:yes stop_codon:yes gene_type:complete
MEVNIITVEYLEKLIEQAMSIYHIDIKDSTSKHTNHNTYSGGMHLRALIVSDDFDNKSLIERHRLIYNLLGKYIRKEIHAISIKALTKNEYIKK